MVDGASGVGFVAGVKVTIKSCTLDVELGLETVGQVVVLEGSPVIDSGKVEAMGVEGDVVVEPGVFLVFEEMLVKVVTSADDDS